MDTTSVEHLNTQLSVQKSATHRAKQSQASHVVSLRFAVELLACCCNLCLFFVFRMFVVVLRVVSPGVNVSPVTSPLLQQMSFHRSFCARYVGSWHSLYSERSFRSFVVVVVIHTSCSQGHRQRNRMCKCVCVRACVCPCLKPHRIFLSLRRKSRISVTSCILEFAKKGVHEGRGVLWHSIRICGLCAWAGTNNLLVTFPGHFFKSGGDLRISEHFFMLLRWSSLISASSSLISPVFHLC